MSFFKGITEDQFYTMNTNRSESVTTVPVSIGTLNNDSEISTIINIAYNNDMDTLKATLERNPSLNILDIWDKRLYTCKALFFFDFFIAIN